MLLVLFRQRGCLALMVVVVWQRGSWLLLLPGMLLLEQQRGYY